MKSVIVIPARYKSSRLPGKPLANLNGKTMIQRVYENALEAAKEIQGCEVIVATDSAEIKDHLDSLGAISIMTSENCKTGSDRVLEAVNQLREKPEIIMNLQGDTPFTTKDLIIPLVKALEEDNKAQVATPGVNLTWEQLGSFREHKELSPSSGTTIIIDKNSYALWFSKKIIPNMKKEDELRNTSKYSPVYKHYGLYCYKYDALKKFSELEQGYYEQIEELEQLRFLENDIKIKVIKMTKNKMPPIAGIDTPEDIKKAEEILQNEN